ncbi:uncharacterized protein K02A2.6-like [Osmia bicornis bicornis]|uniref:uncharacterized protein K02A2.6-like n=1 Tax=Osmia bicornis bicornis TaxID=1437191 RepID=UPI001EAF5931|nr:uncharacterized protein K02A2.6-like [Osmia bicornis bicornis]
MASHGNNELEPFRMEGNAAANWKRFKRQFDNYITAFYDSVAEKRKIAILLHAGGEEINEIYASFALESPELQVVIGHFDEYFLPQTNVTYERFVFLNRKQQQEESHEQFMVALKNLSKTCQFGALKEELIKDIFVSGISDKGLQEKLLRTEMLDIKKAMEICRTRAVVAEHVKTMHIKEEAMEMTVDTVKKRAPGKKITCRYCGYTHEWGRCPAYGKVCSHCQKRNHFAKVCSKNKKEVNCVETAEGEDEIEILEVEIGSINDKETTDWYKVILHINGRPIAYKVDSGAACNIMSLQQYLSLGFTKEQLEQTKVVVKSFTKDIVEIMGKCSLRCQFKDVKSNFNFFITKEHYENILGLEASERLGLIKRVDILEKNNFVPKKYNDLFDGSVGLVQQCCKIRLDKSIKPVVAPARRIPYTLFSSVKEELDRMEAKGIIKRITEPTEWVSQMVVVMKKDKTLRICLDPRPLNRAIKREHYMFPKFEEIVARLKNAKVFCKLDAQSGFWMVPLDEGSSKLCTFQTHWGRYSFNRLPFGLKSAPEICHRIIAQTVEGIRNVASYQDDLLIWAESEEELKEILMEVLQTARRKGIFNPGKCIFNASKVEFLGHNISPTRISVANEKIKAVEGLKKPTDKKSLQRILGLFNYVAKFIPNYSELTASLRELLKDDVIFIWLPIHDEVFNKLKKIITSEPVLGLYDEEKEIEISVDASSTAVGAVLLQERKPVAYASRALTEVQTRYSQIEKELLAVCFGMEKFELYIFGKKQVQVETDHKPLLGLIKKPLHVVPTRLQRMLLRLQPYCFNLSYTPGKQMQIADTLSRDVIHEEHNNEMNDLEEERELQIALLINELPMNKEDWKLFYEESRKDRTIQYLKTYIKEGWPKYYKDIVEECKPFAEFKDEMNESRNVVFRGNRVLVPRSLKGRMLKILHTGHPGISRMISKADLGMFWIGINQDIRRFVQSCETCLKYRPSNVRSELKSKEIPLLPWMEVACDLFELRSKNYLVLVDALSNFIEVITLSSLTSEAVIAAIKSVFARYGIPQILYTDGALYFDSEKFKKFTREWTFKHVKSSPHYPRSNGLAENAVKSTKMLFKKALDAGEDIFLALLNFRNTPRGKVHSPASNLMSRNLRTNIPCTFEYLKPRITCVQDRQILIQLREQSKVYYDRQARKRHELTAGREVMFKKLPQAEWIPGTIVEKAGTPRSYIVKEENGKKFVRNEFHLMPRGVREEGQQDKMEEIKEEASQIEMSGQKEIVQRPKREIRLPVRYREDN